MVYNVIGIMSGSSLDGLDIAQVELTEIGGKWSYDIKYATTIAYDDDMKNALKNAYNMPTYQLLPLHTRFGKFIGEEINSFIDSNNLHHKIHIISSHGHTVYHNPKENTTFQIGDGAQIATITNISTVTDLRNNDIALGGQGAPIVPIADRLLFSEYAFCLNIGGIANISINKPNEIIAFDICAANQILNYFANKKGLEYDNHGELAASGQVNETILNIINDLEYFKNEGPKSLDNQFSNKIIETLHSLSIEDALATAVQHIVDQVKNSIDKHIIENAKMLITGGGALNTVLINALKNEIPYIEIVEADDQLIQYKESLAMALIGVLRWREEENVLASVTGAKKNSVSGALWVN